MMPEFDVELDRVATGGAGLGTGPDGRVVFVDGGLPGERVRVRTVAEHARRIEAETVAVLTPSPNRRPVRCPHVAEGCGGCDWQHVDAVGQRELRRAVVLDCLRRLARIDDVEVRSGPLLETDRYRTTVRAAVVDGRAGYRRSRSHDVVTVEQCLVAHPLVEEILVEGRFGSAREVTVRAGARTGERLVVVHPTTSVVEVPPGVEVVGADAVADQMRWYHELVGGLRLRISAPSFFQCRPDGAEALVEVVGAALHGSWSASSVLLDAYGGVGLFGALVPWPGSVVGVESSGPAVADAKVNYRAAGRAATVHRARMERWRPEPIDAAVADPARSGLGAEGAAVLAATGAEVVALVSCDPASLARDAGLLIGHGYRLEWTTVVDLFGHTSHVEAVSRFVRETGASR